MPADGNDRTTTRRQLLAGVALGCTAAAGCTTLPAFGQQVRYGSVDEPSSGPPRYRDWMPDSDRENLSNDEMLDLMSMEYLEPGSSGGSQLGTPYGGRNVKPGMEYVGVPFTDFEWAVEHEGSVVAKATIDGPTIEAALADTGYEQVDSYEGYSIYARSDLHRAIAHGEGFVAFSGYIETPLQFLGPILDAGEGRGTRFYEVQSQFERLTDSLGAPPWVRIRRGFFEAGGAEAVLQCQTLAFDGPDVYPGRTFLFEPGSDVSEQDIRDQINDFPQALEADRVAVRVDGPVASVIARMPTDRFRSLDAVTLYEQPIVTWGLEWEPGDDRAVLTHEAGDAVDAAVFTVGLRDLDATVGTDDVPAGAEPVDTQFSDRHDRLEPGDSLSLDVSGIDRWSLVVKGNSPDGDYRWDELNYIPPSLVGR